MKGLAVLLGCYFFLIVPQSIEVNLVTYWKKGDVQKILIKEGFVSYKGDVIEKKEVESSIVTMTVLEESDTNYVVEWVYLDQEAERINVDFEEDAIDKRIDEMFGEVAYVIETDEFGVFKQMLNMDEIVQMMADSLDVLVEESEFKDEDSAFFLEFMKEMFSSEIMQDELVRDMWNYHYYLGENFTADTIAYYDDEIKIRGQKEKVLADGTVSVEADTTALLLMINDSKKYVPNPENSNDSEEYELSNRLVDVEFVENYTYSYDYGWLKYYEKNKIYNKEDGRREEFIIMEDLSDK